MANEEFALHKPKHSDAQIDISISEAFKSLQCYLRRGGY